MKQHCVLWSAPAAHEANPDGFMFFAWRQKKWQTCKDSTEGEARRAWVTQPAGRVTQGNLGKVSNPFFAPQKRKDKKKKQRREKFIFPSHCLLFVKDYSRSRAKKWQTCKDSNLNKVNQNHLCYRYTTGLRCAYNITRLKWFFNAEIKKIL